jgi:hypothetical protein
MNTAFYVVFTLFVLVMVGLAFTAIRWGIRRDRVARRGGSGGAGNEDDR